MLTRKGKIGILSVKKEVTVMKKYKWELLVMPVFLMVLGVILIMFPDIAAMLIAQICAWQLILMGTGFGIAAMLGSTRSRLLRVITAAVMLTFGIWILCNPLSIAKAVGKFIGLLLVAEGLGDLLSARRRGPAPLITGITGAILVLVPMATSRIFFIILGIVALCIGVVELADRLRRGAFRGERDIFDV